MSRRIYENLHGQLIDLNFDALKTAVKMIRSEKCPMEVRARLLGIVLQLQFPKMTAVTVTKRPEVSRAEWSELVANPAIAKMMQQMTFEPAKSKGIISAPPKQIEAGARDKQQPIDAEFTDISERAPDAV